ncbi:bifunctional UDP-N-acetylglucosamine diphosphorylase/glucosamine-1-phosphate N-acetyltransferase GlmU [Marinicella sp. S1101]|uniref:bifunctional UDP-N-acetylglucosamine diphosphorylase/glucosamine-1-phosphate N-acetyltransferase GlmU n=1 Tax=Marinicella marina TaxID=2996016 RepID=UPI002260B2DE|nr:bifunctional UDP-N-acetylglucosamine diphosphorylase/glucosamine-1-phosphate N-acetyltransferase GlmU [Marinicella marina]MCX7553119.1 bifunctional UDP-N-acetylglucosamine diphosphorylase/glucosamine-1-phosphate N-acetyltransferase GlmU [Marinicella marina]MDJ1138851.1 bifunctional UDP-N-acetylglucosamine diphosphorylase/glucosamine-1-phosphate N-acetyltransferase GlmU [Marinicella marina]
MSQALHVVILAAGAGTRMRSSKLKVLHPVAGQAMVDHVYQLALTLKPRQITLVYGHQGDQLKAHFDHEKVNWAEQKQQLGTGHAVQQAMTFMQDDEDVLVLYGDAPLIQSGDLAHLASKQFVLTAILDDATGYGRIVRSGEDIKAIVEHKDASPAELKIKEINSGIIQAPATRLKGWLQQLSNNNQQQEYYLTDVIALAAADKQPFQAIQLADAHAVKGANDMQQLAELEDIFQQRIRRQMMQSGVHLIRPGTVDVRGSLNCGQDVVVDKGVLFEGDNDLGDGVKIGAFAVIKNCQLAAGTQVEAHSMLDGVITTGACAIGPFARLRPGTELAAGSKVGNFVETKKTQLGQNSKASHLTYLGDAVIGDGVNIGAGTITCNYDGVNKFTTTIKDGAFIGSDSQLVAPVTVGKNATIGAGSTITKDTPDEQLTLSRSRQKSVTNWQKPRKK